MNVLLIGGGGREHALAWKLRQSSRLTRLFCTPGNGGITECADVAVIDIDDHEAVLSFCNAAKIDLVVIGPEAPLVHGLSDSLRNHGIAVFGASRAASELEASKAFTKVLCAEWHIPTAKYQQYFRATDALAGLESLGVPIVVKADGLAAGKGVTVCETLETAQAAIAACFNGAFGDAGASVILEEKLIGEEASFFALSDGRLAAPFASAQDYKRAFDGDTGPNTGGMGAVSPAPMMTSALEIEVMQTIINPTIAAMAARGTPFVGVLFAGLMITADGPKLIEYNVRFGDPECQVMMLRLKSDLLTALFAVASGGDVSGITFDWSDQTALTVVMATNGYPDAYSRGTVIRGLRQAADAPGVTIFHAGTAQDNSLLIAKGGRVLNVSAIAGDAASAQALVYKAIDRIDWPEGFCRRDIGWRSVNR